MNFTKLKKIMVVISLIEISLIVAGCVSITSTYKGQVIDFFSKEPIAQACLFRPDGIFEYTDSNGYYQFTDVQETTLGSSGVTAMILDNVRAFGYGTLFDVHLSLNRDRMIELAPPGTVYGSIQCESPTTYKIELEGEMYHAIVAPGENGEFSFINVPIGEYLDIYVYKEEKRSKRYSFTCLAEENQSSYHIIQESYIEFE